MERNPSSLSSSEKSLERKERIENAKKAGRKFAGLLPVKTFHVAERYGTELAHLKHAAGEHAL